MAKQTQTAQPKFLDLAPTFKFFPFVKQIHALILIGVVGLVFYCTSINNEHALDDGIIIHQNDHVIKGRKGIWSILTKDAFESFYRLMNATDQLAGGRYRPLSVVSFAIEQEFLGPYRSGLYNQAADLNQNGQLDRDVVKVRNQVTGLMEDKYEYNEWVDLNNNNVVEQNECVMCWDTNKNFKNDVEEDINVDGVFNEVDCQVAGAFMRHFTNIWTFALGCMLLYLVFARYFFRENQDLAFLAALLFTMHPMHTEAIANVKSRDEIFSLIFISLTFLYVFWFNETKKNKHLFWACAMFFLALLSKEYAVMLLFLIPLAIYTFTKNDFDLPSFFKPLMGYGAAGLGVLLLMKAMKHSKVGVPDSPTKKAVLLLAGALAIGGGLYYFFKNYKQYKSVFITLTCFAVCAAIMIFIKYNFDVKNTIPGKKDLSFWFMPFVYLFTGIFIFGPKSGEKRNLNTLMSWFYLIILAYLGMRLVAVRLKPGVPDTEILNNPYLLADGVQQFCTKGYVLLKYLTLLVFPHPLSSDYSYNTIHYRDLGSWDFWLSMVIHLSILAFGIRMVFKKHILGFAIMTYIFFLLMIGNILMDIGATMGERLIFHSSIGFCIALAWLILKGFERIETVSFNMRRVSLIGLVLIVGFLYGCKAWERNWDWKNDVTLFLKDVNTMPHSVLVLGNAGARWVDLADTKEITGKNIPGQDSTRFNDYNGTLHITDQEVKEGNYKDKREAALYKGIKFLKHAVELHPRYVNGYLNLGLAYFKLRKDNEALFYWKSAEKLYPNNPYLTNYYIVYYNDLKNRGATYFQRGRMDSAAIEYNKCTILRPGEPEGWYNTGGAFFNQGKFAKAKMCWERALQLNPNYAEAKKALPMITPQMLGQAPASAPQVIKR
jgi:hypothetical protein